MDTNALRAKRGLYLVTLARRLVPCTHRIAVTREQAGSSAPHPDPCPYSHSGPDLVELFGVAGCARLEHEFEPVHRLGLCGGDGVQRTPTCAAKILFCVCSLSTFSSASAGAFRYHVSRSGARALTLCLAQKKEPNTALDISRCST